MAQGTVFVDTSAWYALASSADPEHESAKAFWELLKEKGPMLATSDWVLAELIALSERRLGRPVALRVGSLILADPAVRVQIVERSLLDLAWMRYLRAGGPSLVDCSSFELMKRDRIERFFAFDEDFALAGFKPFS